PGQVTGQGVVDSGGTWYVATLAAAANPSAATPSTSTPQVTEPPVTPARTPPTTHPAARSATEGRQSDGAGQEAPLPPLGTLSQGVIPPLGGRDCYVQSRYPPRSNARSGRIAGPRRGGQKG